MNKTDFAFIWFETFFGAVLLFLGLLFLFIMYSALILMPGVVSIILGVLLAITIIAFIRYKLQ